MRSYMEEYCEGIDAAIFSGDVLYDDAERAEFKEYIKRWARTIEKHECDSEEPDQEMLDLNDATLGD